MRETSYPREKIKILLLEGIHPVAGEQLSRAGYQVQCETAAMSEQELLAAIEGVHILGIRSKTRVPSSVIAAGKQLMAIGCFCIGTDQVDLDSAAVAGVPTFNAPFSNTRSVAELVIAEVVMLARKASHRSALMHRGIWQKSAVGSYEVRGKTIGVVGYGHIGPQVGLLAEALGMSVLYHDISKKLPLGNAKQVTDLGELLSEVDFVTLHVPDTDQTRNMITAKEIALMKEGSYLLNLSRGRVVDINALKESLESGHLAGAAVDVYPEEPASNKESFSSPLQGIENVILTPHVGGSTQEAQRNIGAEVADTLLSYIETGTSIGAVNFPSLQLPVVHEKSHRVLNIHRNVPGVLSDINKIIAERDVNILSQYLSTTNEVGYLIMDVGRELSSVVKEEIVSLQTNIRTRLLF